MTDDKVKELLIEYRDVINKLREAGIIRTGKVICDYGEYLVSKILKLKLVDSSTNKGYDATDGKGNKYEIKTRKATAWNKPCVFPVKKEQLECASFLVYVEFDDNWNLIKLLKIPCKEVQYNKYSRVVVNKELIRQYDILPSVPKEFL